MRKWKRPFEDAKDFLTQTAAFVKRNAGTFMGLCLLEIFLFLFMLLAGALVRPELGYTLLQSSAFAVTKLVVLIVAIHTGISALDYMINVIMLHIPADLIRNFRDDFMLRMNYMSMRANTNTISAVLIRFFNVAAFSPNIINSPTMNFIVAFISLFGVVIVLVFKHIFLWLFNTFIKPILRLLFQDVQDKVEPKKEEMTDKLKQVYHKVEYPIRQGVTERKKEYQRRKSTRKS